MGIGEMCNRVVIFTTGDDTVQRAAELMHQYHVGTLVVVEHRDEAVYPVGIVTDRDIVMQVVARDIDPRERLVSDIMSPDLVVVNEDDELFDVVELMRQEDIRRIPVVNGEGALIGILALDDVLLALSGALNAVAGVVSQQRSQEARARA